MFQRRILRAIVMIYAVVLTAPHGVGAHPNRAFDRNGRLIPHIEIDAKARSDRHEFTGHDPVSDRRHTDNAHVWRPAPGSGGSGSSRCRWKAGKSM